MIPQDLDEETCKYMRGVFVTLEPIKDRDAVKIILIYKTKQGKINIYSRWPRKKGSGVYIWLDFTPELALEVINAIREVSGAVLEGELKQDIKSANLQKDMEDLGI